MKELADLNIYIVDRDDELCWYLDYEFEDMGTVNIINEDIRDFYFDHNDIDCFVTQFSSFVMEKDDYNFALFDVLGKDIRDKVQRYMRSSPKVYGKSYYFKTNKLGEALIVSPNLSYPYILRPGVVIYHCLRSALICALEHNVNTIVLPGFKGINDIIEPEETAAWMFEAFNDLLIGEDSKYEIVV